MRLFQGFCHRCHGPVGLVDWCSADFVWCKRCAKAYDVYTSPDGLRGGRHGRWRRIADERRAGSRT